MRLLAPLILFLILCQLPASSVIWSYSAQGAITGKPLLISDKVVFSTYEGNVFAFSADRGSIAWAYETGGKLPVPVAIVSADTLVAASSEGNLNFISLAGKETARATLDSTPLYLAGGQGSAYVSEKDKVQAFSSSGKPLWNAALSEPAGPISAFGKSVYFTSGGKLYSLDSKTGKQNWAAPVENAFMSAPVAFGGSVYVGAIDGRLYAFDSVSGYPRWFYQTGGWVQTTPVASGESIFFGSNDGYFYSVSDSGKLRFRAKSSEAVWAEPMVYESGGRQLAVFSSNDGNVYCVDASNGEPVWSYSAGGRVGAVSEKNGVLFFGTSSGQFYSLSPSPICSFSWPRTGSAVGDWPVTVEGTAYSRSSLQFVEVRVEGGQWQMASGTDKWRAEVDFTSLPYSAFKVECRATDSSTAKTSGDYSSITLVKGQNVGLQKMAVVAPSEAAMNETISIGAQDSRGNDLKGVTLIVAGVKSEGDSPFSVVLGKSGSVPISLEKPGFEPVSFAIAGIGGGDILTQIIALIVVCALGFFAYKKFIAKKK